MVAVGGGNSRMVNGKAMEHTRVLMETDTSGNTLIIRKTGMELKNFLISQYTKESGKMICLMGRDFTGIGLEINIGDSI